ncbi:LURP-one-related/scramblase family protein [Salinirussus salinus]|jgi:uncharacterized protein YxjI|uniref:LURP-one-related/scramblase family protein n=1 Tax=Salinirussus salinus TaxID=1198300 RepID=UPI001359100A|nr:hypothetical protein [Salinirussus salinus]
MATDDTRRGSALDLDDDQYTVEQSLIRNKYAAYDSDGDLVVRGKQKLLKMKEEFPFVDADGEEVFTVEAGQILDVAGNYAIIDAETGDRVALLDNDFSIFQDVWTVRHGETEAVVGRITSRGAAVTLARNLIPIVGPLIPHKYEITGPDGGHVGQIDGELSLRDRYQITIDDAGGVPTDAIVTAAMVIDAIQGN